EAGAQCRADERGELVGAAADPALDALAFAARGGGPREHGVLGRHPALAVAAQPARHPLHHAGGAQHPGVAELGHHRALRMPAPAAGQPYRSQLVGLPPVWSRHHATLRQVTGPHGGRPRAGGAPPARGRHSYGLTISIPAPISSRSSASVGSTRGRTTAPAGSDQATVIRSTSRSTNPARPVGRVYGRASVPRLSWTLSRTIACCSGSAAQVTSTSTSSGWPGSRPRRKVRCQALKGL